MKMVMRAWLLDSDIFLWYEIEKRVRSVYRVWMRMVVRRGMRGLMMRLMKIGDDERHSVGLPYWPSWLLSNSAVEHFCKWRKFLWQEHYKVWSKYKIALNFFPTSMHCTHSLLHTTQTSEKYWTAMCYCTLDIKNVLLHPWHNGKRRCQHNHFGVMTWPPLHQWHCCDMSVW